MANERVVIVGCKNTMLGPCKGCEPCLVDFNNRKGSFSSLSSTAQLVGLVDCGGCPGIGIIASLNAMDRWAKGATPPVNVTDVISANCLEGCPHKIVTDTTTIPPKEAYLWEVVEDKSAQKVTHKSHQQTPPAKGIFK